MATVVGTGTQVSFRAVFVDAQGNPTTVDTRQAAVVELSDPNVATVVSVNPDGLSGTVQAISIGLCQVRIRADADRGDGYRELIVMGDLEVVPGEAVAGTVELTPVV